MGERALQLYKYFGRWEKKYYENYIRMITNEENSCWFDKNPSINFWIIKK